jgi:hypothetical protein
MIFINKKYIVFYDKNKNYHRIGGPAIIDVVNFKSWWIEDDNFNEIEYKVAIKEYEIRGTLR